MYDDLKKISTIFFLFFVMTAFFFHWPGGPIPPVMVFLRKGSEILFFGW